MKKGLLMLAVLTTFVLRSFGQNTSVSSALKDGGKFSIGLEAGVPDYPTSINVIIGFSFKYEAPLGRRTCFTISAGYNAFLNDQTGFISDIPPSYGYIPVKAGLKYYVIGGFFFEAQTGVTFATRKISVEAGTTYFIYSPGLGYTFGSHIEAGIRFEGWVSGESVINQTSLRLAYRF